MMQVALCITQQHDLRLVFVALLVCLIGSAATVQLFGRILSASGPSRVGWVMLTAVSTGTMVWSTHFVAMMAFRTQAPVVLDPILTLASLVLAIAVAAPGLALAATERRWAAAAGGAIIGIAMSSPRSSSPRCLLRLHSRLSKVPATGDGLGREACSVSA